jgi:hypothetical protein
MATPNPASTNGLQLVLKPLAVGNVQALVLFEHGKQLYRLLGVVAIPLQLRQKLALPGDVLLAKGNMFVGLSEMVVEHCAVHTASVAHVFGARP